MTCPGVSPVLPGDYHRTAEALVTALQSHGFITRQPPPWLIAVLYRVHDLNHIRLAKVRQFTLTFHVFFLEVIFF